MANFVIQQITAEAARPVRKTVLRANFPWEATIYPGDDHLDTVHFGAFHVDELVGVITVSRDSPPGEANSDAWRLRGVAVSDFSRRQGCGMALVQACVDYVIQNKGTVIWANGRTEVLDFYRALDFQVVGDEFITETGPHYRVVRRLNGEG